MDNRAAVRKLLQRYSPEMKRTGQRAAVGESKYVSAIENKAERSAATGGQRGRGRQQAKKANASHFKQIPAMLGPHAQVKSVTFLRSVAVNTAPRDEQSVLIKENMYMKF